MQLFHYRFRDAILNHVPCLDIYDTLHELPSSSAVAFLHNSLVVLRQLHSFHIPSLETS